VVKIFLVEDDQSLANMYKTELELSGYEVTVHNKGSGVIEKVKSVSPDIVLLDIMLPDKSGVEVLEDLKSDISVKNIPVMMLTNFGNDEFIKQALENGAEDYVLKHKITPSELASKVLNILTGERKKISPA